MFEIIPAKINVGKIKVLIKINILGVGMESEEFEECVQKLKKLYEIAIETVESIEEVKKESAVKFKKAVDFIYKTVNKTD